MASSVSIDVDSEKNGDGDLQFQDIPHDDDWAPVSKPAEGGGKTHTFTNFPHSAADSDDEDEGEKTEFLKDKKNMSFWTFEYYQQFFDVETTQVGSRILGSMLPRPGGNYLDSHIRPNPDLYGPFWICTTLVFTTAIAGNLANYIQAAGQNYHWVYDFHKVTFAATAIFSYWWVIPFILFGLLWWRGNPARYTFLELICVYGYSLAIYIPISLLWVIPVGWLQWLLVVLGALLSGSALLLAFWPAVREDKKQVAFAVVGVIFLLHAALAMGFMLYFFHVPSKAASPLTPINATTLATAHPADHQLLKDLPPNLATQQPSNKAAVHTQNPGQGSPQNNINKPAGGDGGSSVLQQGPYQANSLNSPSGGAKGQPGTVPDGNRQQRVDTEKTQEMKAVGDGVEGNLLAGLGAKQ
ncbi:protein YIPF1-like [Littorina saxatilis]|uniref:Yip1 domain-containing protein n=1 Tax=Littorina saxatilis TaxID=31220 RepID=A0AAN9B9X5_9CAEN